MLKIVGINTVNYGSTGRIMLNTLMLAKQFGHEVYTACSKYHYNADIGTHNPILINFKSKIYSIDTRMQYITGLNDCFSFISTRIFLNKLNEIKPDIIHIHNLHGRYININMLFKWIKKHNVKVIWTLHDCWAFTGKCAYFDMVDCSKWQNGCHDCPQCNVYPASNVDRTKYLYNLKRKCFTDIKNLTLVTPSKWLAGLVKQSFLKNYNVCVINNGIDLSIFKPTDSDIRNKLNIIDKKVILGCAMPFNERKGFDVFIELSKKLDDSYVIVLVGLNKDQIDSLPDNIIGIERTADTRELAQYYTIADVFVNPTREDNFPTVNLEALACGTPIITFDTGGSPECIDDSCGIVVKRDDIDALYNAIKFVTNECPFNKGDCITRAKQFDMNDKFMEYVKLYDKN